jgi:hypothetical protein
MVWKLATARAEEVGDLGVEWNLLQCGEGSEDLDRPGRPWPSSHEVADSLLVSLLESDETRPIATVLPSVRSSGNPDDMVRFTSAPASPDDEDEIDVVAIDGPEGTFRPLRREPVTVPWEPESQGACGGCDRGTATGDEDGDAMVDSRDSLLEVPEEGVELRPSPIQNYWTRIQARRGGAVERARGRVAHIRPMPRVGGRLRAYYHRPDPRRFNITTTAPVVRSQEIISRVTSPLGSIAEETLAETARMARHQATQVPRIRQRDAILQVHITAPQRTMATQTLMTMMGGMRLDEPVLTSAAGDEVTLHVSPEASTGEREVNYSDISSDGAIEADSNQGETSTSAGTPVQDERDS